MDVPLAQISPVEDRYREMTPMSRVLFERATQSLPGGNTRTTIYHQPYPFYFEHGEGCRIYDVDGNERLDFINNYTSLILGHAPPPVVKAVQRQAARGFSAAAPSELEIELAEVIKRRMPGVEQLRFSNSGTEATMMALRAARAYTGRDKIAKFEGAYHGTHDYAAVEVSAGGAIGAGAATGRGGIPEAVAGTVVSMPFNDQAGVERVIGAHQDELAALIVEPVVGAGGILVPQDGFLSFLRDITRRWGIVLIFDEVISFRIGYHGAQGYFGVVPDLTTLGKIIGGGLPVGAFGGRADIMALFDPRSASYIGHGGTFNANPVTMAAGLATLGEMTPAAYERLAALGAELKQKLCDLFVELNIPAQVNQIGSLFNIHFSAAPVTTYPAALAADRVLLKNLYVAAINRGVAFTGRGMGCLSTPMTSVEIDRFVEALRHSLADLGVA
ncbi:MAG: aspartate aminotransferase family protein [Roseiflexaceae bacterium]